MQLESSPKEAGRPPDSPSLEQVRAALARMQASRHFAHSQRLVQFLEYVVEQTLAGNLAGIKEYQVGVTVFQRRAAFDPRSDPVVRVEARRLRVKLERYYAEEGRDDPLVIGLPKGGYIPTFALRPVPSGKPRLRNWVRFVATAAGVALLAGALWLYWGRPKVSSVAILPFLNLTGDAANDYLCDGLADELTDDLARVAELRVVARTSSFRFKGKPQDVRGIGAQLGVDHLVEGSVVRVGDHARVTLQLVRTSDGYHILSRSFDARLPELPMLDAAMAVPLIAALRPDARRPIRRTPLPEARDLVLKAAAWRGTTGLDAYQKALAYLEEAVRLDPAYADAWAALAGLYATSGANYEATAGESVRLAKAAGERALELDPDCAAAHGAIGFVDAMFLLDWKRGEAELRQAIRLMPSGAAHYNWLGNLLMYQGRFDEALVHLRTARRLDPLSPVLGITEGLALFYARRYDGALERWQQVERAHPGTVMVHLFLGRAWQAKGQMDRAMAEYRKVPPAVGDFMVAALLAVQGQAAEARRMLALLENPPEGQGPPRAFNLACIRAALGDRDAAFAWLERAYADRKITQLIVEPYLVPLRNDARFATLRAKAGFGR